MNATIAEQLKEPIKAIVQLVLTENKLGSSPELEEYIANHAASKVAEALANKHLNLRKILKYQKDFALKKPKSSVRSAKGNCSDSAPESERKIEKNE